MKLIGGWLISLLSLAFNRKVLIMATNFHNYVSQKLDNCTARIQAEHTRFVSEWFVYISTASTRRFGGFDCFEDAEAFLLDHRFNECFGWVES